VGIEAKDLAVSFILLVVAEVRVAHNFPSSFDNQHALEVEARIRENVRPQIPTRIRELGQGIWGKEGGIALFPRRRMRFADLRRVFGRRSPDDCWSARHPSMICPRAARRNPTQTEETVPFSGSHRQTADLPSSNTLTGVMDPGPLLASGRDSDIFEYGPGLVLRRSREGRSMVREARVMEYVRSQGFSVPAVEEVSEDGLDMVIERIEGPDMVAMMGTRPWAIPRLGRVLADLHHGLHSLTAPPWLEDAPVGHGVGLLHLDLHPLNVMMGPKGPVVIDWARACRGDTDVDVAVAWILMASGEVPTGRLMGTVLGRARSALVKSFVGSFDIDPVRRRLREVVAWKVLDPHISAPEQVRMWRVVNDAGGGAKE
jgi:tRNA A-37 threonylcarbamoyl transferase component Bud32